MKRRYTVLALVAGVHATVGLIVLAQSQNGSSAAGANKGGTATPQGTGAGPFVTLFQSKSLEPDIQHGAVIAAQGTAAGARNNALMTPIAKALNADDIRDVTAYYAGTNGPALPLKPPDPALVKRGEALAKIGSAEKQIQSCNNCHGPGGVGESPAIPYLAGQYSNYIAFTLREWRRGYRKNSSDQMAVVAHKLNDRDIAAVAAYYQQVASPVKVAEAQPKE